MAMNNVDIANDLIQFIAESPTKYHAVDRVKSDLIKQGYTELSLVDHWGLDRHGKYFIVQDNSALVAFNVGDDILDNGVRLTCAHTDSPTFKVKPIAEMKSPHGYIRLNTQGYAWPILSTWFDRPLSIAGRVALKGESIFSPVVRLVDLVDPLLLIPNIAFHLTKGKTDGSISKQKEMLPIMGIADSETDVSNLLRKLLAKNLELSSADEILDYELYLYPCERGSIIGLNSDFVITPRQDDLVMVYAAYKGLLASTSDSVSKMIALFDAEEETNSTLSGADTPFLRNVISKITKSVGGDDSDIARLIHNSFAVSLDTSFAVHPNYMESGDPTCSPVVNRGVAIKYDANMHYSTNAVSAAIFQEICNSENIPFQRAAANSDLRTGGTLASGLQTQVEIRSVDVGIASWAVHSAYESCGTKDLDYLVKAVTAFMSINDRR